MRALTNNMMNDLLKSVLTLTSSAFGYSGSNSATFKDQVTCQSHRKKRHGQKID